MPQTSALSGKFVDTTPRWYGRHQRALAVLLQRVHSFWDVLGLGYGLQLLSSRKLCGIEALLMRKENLSKKVN